MRNRKQGIRSQKHKKLGQKTETMFSFYWGDIGDCCPRKGDREYHRAGDVNEKNKRQLLGFKLKN